MKILYVVPDLPLTPNGYGGASALAYSHLELLAHSSHTLTMALVPGWDADEFQRYLQDQPAQWSQVQAWVASWQHLKPAAKARGTGHVRQLLDAVRGQAHRAAAKGHASLDPLRQLIEREKPDLIWAEHWQPALIATAASDGVPVVYSHHDWKWRIKALRHEQKSTDIRQRYRSFMQRRQEEDLVRHVAGCVSGSASEVRQLQNLGAKTVGYLPTTVEPIEDVSAYAGPPRVVHLGTLSATASREGLRRFLEVVWPSVRRQMRTPPELWIVGRTEDAPDALKTQLAEVGAICTGFVEDLGTVLRPFDLHIMPWEYDTGTRTRLPVAFNHSQVVVATKAAVACLPEAHNDENSVLVDGLEDMADRIVALFVGGERERLGLAARKTLHDAFTREAMQQRFNAFIEECVIQNPQSKIQN